MDVSTAFINAELDRDDIYFSMPPGYNKTKNVCLKAKRALYGLPQAPRLWNRKFTNWLTGPKTEGGLGFKQSKKDPCYFTYTENGKTMHLILYVDDLAFAGNCPKLIAKFKKEISEKFEMTDLGLLNWFLGSEVTQDLEKGTTKLTQASYIQGLMEKYEFMADIKPTATPSRPESKYRLSKAQCPLDPKVADQTLWWRPMYRSVIGSLLYAAVLSRPDIAAEVAILSQFLDNPGQEHWDAAVYCLAYLKGTPDHGITYTRPSITSSEPLNVLTMFVDATWADDTDDRKSTSGMVAMMNGGAICWKSKKQPIIAQSSCESEIISACFGANEASFLRQLLSDIGYPQQTTRVYEDNTACLQISKNPGALSSRSKHFEIRWMKIQEYVKHAVISMVYCPTKYQLADLLTKSNQPRPTFVNLRDMITGVTKLHHHKY
jgi:hypothetical protein